MKLFQEIRSYEAEQTLLESQKAANKEVTYVISIVNKIYNEWKKTGRRVNAVDLITTSANKISTINPSTVEKVHEATRLKMATIIMRCLDIPPWKDPFSKEKIYKKLFPLIHKLEKYDPNTGSGGNLRQVIMTRLSATLCHESKSKVFVAYEPTISKTYLEYLFSHDSKPKKVYKMEAFSLPGDFGTLMKTLRHNQEKVEKKESPE